MQQQNSENESESNEIIMALLAGLHSKIIDISNRMQQLPPGDNGFDISEKSNEIIRLLSEGQPRLDISEFERGREKFFDLLIEGPSGLSVVAILDSSGFDRTAFAADTYNNNHVKFYFDCLAWVRVSVFYDFRMILDDIIKSVMPPSRVSVIIGEDYQFKESILRDFLTNRKYFIVLDDVCDNIEIWDDLEEVLPDNQNGSRVLILVTDPDLLASLEMENGETIRLDSVLIGGPLIRLKHEAWQFFILHYGSMPLENYVQGEAIPTILSRICSVLELPFHLKICCIYLCLFPPGIEISTRQLYHLWVAEGFIPYNSEETAEHYLKELIHRGFIQVSKRRAGGTIKACYVPSLVYTPMALVAEKTGFVWMPDMEEESLANVKRCFILEDLIDFFSLKHSDLYLQSFLNHSSESDRLALIDCENFCKKFKHLRVLYLGSAVLDQYPPGLGNLYLLKNFGGLVNRRNPFVPPITLRILMNPNLSEKSNEIIRLLSEGQPRLDISEFERGREKFFDLLIEGPSGLSVVAILDRSGFDKTAFAADTCNNNHVKFYFDCLAWVRVSLGYDYGKILDGIIKSAMTSSMTVRYGMISKKFSLIMRMEAEY
ncbi:hypothetical protein WN944_006211 [Citrus x changshan-huyou]|uniref:NB-ARC domain-containing protein n=1 Tax=Citrus x changshan-huyou TaxID=2935761 RepID=A0AAP0ML99_9ROSI